jgi:hypothetical protein
MEEHVERMLDAGRAIRPFLRDLAPERWLEIDAALAAALADTPDAERVFELLTADRATAAWTVTFIADGAPPSADAVRGYEPLRGLGSPIRAPRFRCQHGDYLWYRRSAALAVPQCPTHRIPLVADRG